MCVFRQDKLGYFNLLDQAQTPLKQILVIDIHMTNVTLKVASFRYKTLWYSDINELSCPGRPNAEPPCISSEKNINYSAYDAE